jgi:hypothetical protein
VNKPPVITLPPAVSLITVIPGIVTLWADNVDTCPALSIPIYGTLNVELNVGVCAAESPTVLVAVCAPACPSVTNCVLLS